MPDANIVAVTGFSPEPEPAALVPAGAENPIPLDGTWDFVHAVEDYRASPAAWRPIKVPGPWQAQFADLRMRGGTGIYRRAIDIPAGWKREHVFLRFGAVFHIAREFCPVISVVGVAANVRASIDDQHFFVTLTSQPLGNNAPGKTGPDNKPIKHGLPHSRPRSGHSL